MPFIAKRTPLFYEHVQTGAHFTTFSGWEMPLYYRGIIAEHRAVRSAAGLFDVSHLGRISVRGLRATATLEHLLSTRVSDLSPGAGRYSLFLNHKGGVVDDLVVFRKAEDDYLLVVNASNRESDLQWIKGHALPDTSAKDISARDALLALQGPLSVKIMELLCDLSPASLRPFRHMDLRLAGIEAFVSRTGYTGEDGFEIGIPTDQAKKAWQAILHAGSTDMLPAGLGARDSLRMEMGYCLYGAELTEEIDPWEAGLGKLVHLEKRAFIGKEALDRNAGVAPNRRLKALALEAGIPRSGCGILSGTQKVGVVTSGGFSPSLGKGIGLGYIAAEFAVTGAELLVDIRGKLYSATVRESPLYKRK